MKLEIVQLAFFSIQLSVFGKVECGSYGRLNRGHFCRKESESRIDCGIFFQGCDLIAFHPGIVVESASARFQLGPQRELLVLDFGNRDDTNVAREPIEFIR